MSKQIFSYDTDTQTFPAAFNAALPNTAAGSLPSALPNTAAAVANHDDSTSTPYRIIGLGSSVGVGATLPDPTTQAPVARLYGKLAPALTPLSNIPTSVTNGSVNGTTIYQGSTGDYATAKNTAGGTPNLLVLAYGMNDGMPEQYHRGETYPGVYAAGLNLIQAAQADGSDVVIFTTPHPRTDIMTDSYWSLSGASSYPSSTPIPATTQAASVVNITTASGATVPASYRHLRINQALRKLAADTGAALIDVEQYWFQAIATQGLAALFNSGEYAHPNLLGHTLSYWKAIDDFVAAYRKTTITAGPQTGGYKPAVTYKPNNAAYTSTTTLTNDTQLGFTAGPNQAWEVSLDIYYTGGAGNLRVGLNLPTGASGSIGVHGPGIGSSAYASHPMTARRVTLPDTYGLPVGTNTADAYARAKALVVFGSNGGTVYAQFCQDSSSSSATTVYANSTMRATRIA